MGRIEGLGAKRAGLLARFAYWYSRRSLGKVPEPLTVMAHHGWISFGAGAFELALERSRTVEPRLKALASLKAAALIGCPF